MLELHRMLAGRGDGSRRLGVTVAVRVGKYRPPEAQDVSGLMFELLEWWNGKAAELGETMRGNRWPSGAVFACQFEKRS